jgi:uncharacterized protein (DUF2252 family)
MGQRLTRAVTLLCLLPVAGSCDRSDSARSTTTRPSETSPATQAASAGDAAQPLDVLREAYGRYMPDDDPLAFAMKMRAVSAGKSGLWRGGKDLFFRWCRGRTADWLADDAAWVVQQGDQHLGNIGTYLADGKFGALGFGMVDFDDSHKLPFQFELLQGVVTLRLAAEDAQVTLDDARLNRLIDTVLREYAAASRAAANGKTAVDLLGNEPMVAKLVAARGKQHYAKELEEYTETGDRLIGVRASRRGKVKDILRPLPPERAAQLGDAVAQAVLRDPKAAALFRLKTPEEFRAAIADAALRTRVGSAGSQGLRKYFVLMDRPLAGVEHDVIVYVKQEVPSSAERAGLVPPDPRDPGQRCAEDIELLTWPRPYFNGWCRIGDESYWVTVREPWSDELDSKDVATYDDLLWAGRAWAISAGASHHEPGQAEMITARSNSKLSADLRRLSDEYVKQLETDSARLAGDARVKELVARAEAALERSRAGVAPKQQPEKKARRPGRAGQDNRM